ncbi:hypothetical protein [Lentibacillus sediminis]|uniref:hypothetical protein n=1 Tax=Lentibacillus sediminis TaxID=1940529 RepID=UPI000C1BE6E4|nr:hypothetical protein [Lentibacillus sediminis]
MSNSIQDKHEDFIQTHDAYFSKWADVMKTGDTSQLEKIMSAEYYVTFFIRGQEKPAFFNRSEAVKGMRQSVSFHGGEKKRFENRVIRLRNAKNAVVFYEQVLEKNGEELARLFTIENWYNNGEQWKIIREVQEHV